MVDLSKGLDAMFYGLPEDDKSKAAKVTSIYINNIEPSPLQTRSDFSETDLKELSESIKEHGVIQPILVRELKNGKYELIAGERRVRASKLINLKKIPAIIRNIDNENASAHTVIENIQRANLNPIEEAKAYMCLIDNFCLSHEDVSKKVGKPRSTISNSLRLLDLHESVQQSIIRGVLSSGHGKLLATLDIEKQNLLADKAISNHWSVRKLEEYLAVIPKKEANNKIIPLFSKKELQFFSEALTNAIGGKTKVELNRTGKGRVVIDIESKEIIENMLGALRDKKT